MKAVYEEGRDTGRTKRDLEEVKETEQCDGNAKKSRIRDHCLVKDTKLKTEEAGRAPPPSVSNPTQRHTSLHRPLPILAVRLSRFLPVHSPSSL